MAKSVSYTKESYQFMMKMYQGSSKNEIAKQMGIAYGRFIEENKDINIPIKENTLFKIVITIPSLIASL